MLYQAKRLEIAQPISVRLWRVLNRIVISTLRHQHDQRYLEGLNARQLEDIGLRRTAARGYRLLDL